MGFVAGQVNFKGLGWGRNGPEATVKRSERKPGEERAWVE